MWHRGEDRDLICSYLLAAIDFNPRNSDAFNNLGLVEKERGNIDGALHYFFKALSVLDKSRSSSCSAIYNNIASVLPDPTEKIAFYRKAIKCDPAALVSSKNLGYILENSSRVWEAIDIYSNALKVISLQTHTHSALSALCIPSFYLLYTYIPV